MSQTNWNEFFETWEKNYSFTTTGNIGRFVRDGIPCPNVYWATNPRILFVMKDYHTGDNDYDSLAGLLDEILNDNTSGRAWNPINFWAGSLLFGKQFSPFNTEQCSNEQYLRSNLQHVAVMNIKKASGFSSAKYSELKQIANEQQEKIREEIAFCKPDIIIACSKDVFTILQKQVYHISNKNLPKIPLTGKMEKYNYGHYFDIRTHVNQEKPIYVIEYRHPSQSNVSTQEHHENMLRIRCFALEENSD